MSRDEIERVCYEWQLESQIESWAKVWGQFKKKWFEIYLPKAAGNKYESCDTQRQILLANIGGNVH